MTKLKQWGTHLRHLRNQAGLTQDKLIEQFSYAISTLSDEEIKTLQQAELYDEITTYLGDILDKPALSKLETGKRTIASRKRTLAFVWGFNKLDAINAITDANQFLELGGFGHLTPAETAVFCDNWGVPAAPYSPLLEPEIVKSTIPKLDSKINSNSERNFSIMPLLLSVLALLAVGWFAREQVISRDTFPPMIDEDFSENVLDLKNWNTTDAPHAQIDDGQLLFDVPLNESGEWSAEYLKHYGGAGQISRLKYSMIIDTPQVYESGDIGISTGCRDDSGFLNIFVGGEPSTIRVEFPNREEIEDWNRDVTALTIMPIEVGETYEIDLNWTGNVVELSVNGELQDDLFIACNMTTYFNIMASTPSGRKVRGFMDDLQVWY